MRSKAQWVEDGEQNSKFFLNLEKRNYNIKHIKKLIQGTNIITDPVAILKEQKRYYDNLYSSKQHHFKNFIEIEDHFLRNTAIPKLSNDERYFCDQKLQPRDYNTALKNLANNKSSGSDGLTTNFYKFFWPDIRDLLVASYNYTYDNKQLSQDQKIAVINLLPKKDKDLRFLKNWRPVSLLNTDYKILTKALAQKLQNVIGQIVNRDQIGYIKGRFIGETIRTIHDIVYLTEEQNMNGFITLIDFEKAFDSIEWNFLFKCLKTFNFGDAFLDWIKILYTDIKLCVTNNGYYSECFKLSRSIRQGCPISTLLFILVAEILAIAIRTNENIHGLQFNTKINHTYKLAQLADDTTLFLADLDSIAHSITLFDKFKMISGLTVNLEKTEIIPLGRDRNKTINLSGNLKKITYNMGPFKTLGIWFSNNHNDAIDLNYSPKIEKVKTLLQIWLGRHLSLKGKITILRALIIITDFIFIYSLVCSILYS